MTIRVAVVSRHEVTRAGLDHLVGLDPSRARIVASVDEHGPLPRHDVAVIDLSHRPQGAHDLGRLLARTDGPVVALVADDEPEVAVHAKRLGVGALVTMAATADDLLASIEKAVGTADGDERRELSRDRVHESVGLTPRELDILELIAAGLSNQEIAARLYLSINTVKSTIRLAYKRIGATSRSQAVLWALRHDLHG